MEKQIYQLINFIIIYQLIIILLYIKMNNFILVIIFLFLMFLALRQRNNIESFRLPKLEKSSKSCAKSN